MGRGAVGRRVHQSGRHCGVLDELVPEGGLLDHVVGQRGECARGIGTEPDALDRGGAVAADRGHLLAGQCKFDRAAHHLCGHGRQGEVWVWQSLGAEPAPDVRGDDADPLDR